MTPETEAIVSVANNLSEAVFQSFLQQGYTDIVTRLASVAGGAAVLAQLVEQTDGDELILSALIQTIDAMNELLDEANQQS